MSNTRYSALDGGRRVCGLLGMVGALVLGALGCAGTVSDDREEEALAGTTAELKNGETYDGSAYWPGAVGLRIWTPRGAGWWTECSGQVVSKRSILTAAHCLDVTLDNPGELYVIAWRPSATTATNIVLSAWVTAHRNPRYHETDNITVYDVGLINSPVDLQNVTSGGSMAKLTPSNIKMFAFGFGPYGDGPNDDDAYGRYGEVFPQFVTGAPEYRFENTGTAPELCAGDSGGPLKSNASGPLLVYGVASQRSGGSGVCQPVGHWATTAYSIGWIKDTIVGSCWETSTFLS